MKEGHQEVLFTLKPDVVVSEVETPSPSAGLGEHEEIGSVCDEPKSDESSDENQSLSSGKAEVLVMGTDLFWAAKLVAGGDGGGYAGEDWFV